MVQQEPSLYSLFEGTPWSPSLPASSGMVTCEALIDGAVERFFFFF